VNGWSAPEGITYGTLVVGLLALAAELADWYPGLKPLKKAPLKHLAGLVPFTTMWAVGALMAMCAGGVVGWATGWFVWGAGWLGDGVLIYGVGGERQDVAQALSQPLTNGGLAMTLIILVMAVVRISKAGEDLGWHHKRGLISGATLGLSAGVAAVVAVPLASAVNLAGAWIPGGTL
jgi:hypothetical protein